MGNLCLSIDLCTKAQDDYKQAGEGIKPVSFSAHKNFKSELSYAQSILVPIAQNHDLIEPFERLILALKEINRMGVGEKGKGG